MRLPPEIKTNIDFLRDGAWSGNLSNPLHSIDLREMLKQNV